MKAKIFEKSAVLTAVFVAVVSIFTVHGSIASPVLTADTSRPTSSTFAIGEAVSLTFSVSGLVANAADTLSVTVDDESGNFIGEWQSPVVANTSGDWQATWAAPNTKLGFYRVQASLTDGTTVTGLGSRPSGYITYCIVPNPSLRVAPTEANARFGMQGGYNTNVNILPYLGIRWVIEGYTWSQMEPNAPGQFATNVAAAAVAKTQYPAKYAATDSVTYNGLPWQIYTIADLHGVPSWAANSDGSIKSADLAYWSTYCGEAAADYAKIYPNQTKHIYQLTWEPDMTMTAAEINAAYAASYSAIHAADPKAVVVGPTSYDIFPGQIDTMQSLSALGYGNVSDGISIHPYFTQSAGTYAVNLPENVPGYGGGPMGNLVQNVRELGNVFPNKVFYGTEQGFDTDPPGDTTGGEDNELIQAEGNVRENLIMLGEGYQFNIVFYIADYPTNQDFGYYYNLVPGAPYGAGKIGPKPVAPAYAAQSFLLEGTHTDGVVPNLGTNQYGYVFQNGNNYTVALWSNTTGTQTISLPVGVNTVNVYDWMGNMTTVNGSNDKVTLTIGPKPIYVTGVSSAVL